MKKFVIALIALGMFILSAGITFGIWTGIIWGLSFIIPPLHFSWKIIAILTALSLTKWIWYKII